MYFIISGHLFPFLITSSNNTMSLAGMSIFINPPPISNQSLKFDFHRKGSFLSPGLHTLRFKDSENVYRRCLSFKKKMLASLIDGLGGSDSVEPKSLAVSALEHEDLVHSGCVSFHQIVGGLHTLFNHLSKRIIIVTYTGFILMRRDGFTFWAALGCLLNAMLSLTLKWSLKQERPVSGLSSDPGMPSSHAQTLFYTVVFVILTSVCCRGLNGVTVILSVLVAMLGSYFSWLRVLQGYHTISQVVVGAVVGSIFSVIWFRAWEEIVHNAYNSYLWVRILVIGGIAPYYLRVIFYAIQNLLNSED